MLARLICWLRGHEWDVIAVNHRKWANLCHLHSMAGFHAICRRCDYEWDDTGGPFFGADIVCVRRRPMPLPAARVR